MNLTYIYRVPRYFIRKFIEALRSISWHYGLISLHKNHKIKLLKLKNKHKGKPCVIIGGGPSLKKMNINKFRTHISIGCNAFYLLGDKYNFFPDYYTVEDPLPAKENKNKKEDSFEKEGGDDENFGEDDEKIDEPARESEKKAPSMAAS